MSSDRPSIEPSPPHSRIRLLQFGKSLARSIKAWRTLELPSSVVDSVHSSSHSRPPLLTSADWLLATVITVGTSLACLAIGDTLPGLLLHTMNFWFESDTLREVNNMTTVDDSHRRTSAHPLFSLIGFTSVYLLKHGLTVSPLQAVRLVTGIVGGVWIGMLYVLLRLMGCRILDTAVFTVLGLCSASALFWLTLPNTFSWGSLSVMSALSFLLLSERRSFRPFAYVATSAFTLSITVTNWMAGLLVTLAKWPWKRALQLSVNAFCLVVILWSVQKDIFPTAEFFLGRSEVGYLLNPESGGFLFVAQSFVFHSLIAPAIRLIDDDGYIQVGDDAFRLSQRMSFQFSPPGSAGALGMFAVVLWSALLLMGLWRLVKRDGYAPFRLVLGLFLAFQLLLHLFYGEETFNYSLHFTPLLLAVAAFGTLGPGRPYVLISAALLAICAGVNNWQQFSNAIDLSTQLTPQRDIMIREMHQDQIRPWPRGVGHVVLAAPGTPEMDHAYHEPGGDFSPNTPSFGVSFWLCDTNGHPIITSQTLPISEIEQTFVPSGHADVPDIITQTPYYEARWTRLDAKHWQLRFTNRTTYVLAILIRSVGPAGGPVTSLEYDGERLQINERWAVRVRPAPADVSLGDENAPGWITEHSPAASWVNDSGWGYARLTLPTDASTMRQEYYLVLTDQRLPIKSGGPQYRLSTVTTHVDLPDPRFSASMQAQRAHLMMSLVGNETRPGDPTYFHRAWNRQGSYIMAALARAGDPHVSWVLSQFIATHDFVGGYGAEADEPGLAIWSLTEASKYIADPIHDAWLWPHIRRKAGQIEGMLTAHEPIVESFFIPTPGDNDKHGQQTRRSLIATPSRDGLIVGRVGNEWPVLYVNAVSYRALIAAAEVAERLGKRSHATRWRDYARAIQSSWQRQFLKDPTDKATYTVGLWPSTIAGPIRDTFAQYLSADRTTTVTRPSVSARLARAHQYLRLGQLDALWTTLRNIWEHQASPGLYTWEASPPATDDVADGWQYVRGWPRVGAITPDYETAALLLLLQQDMLAYIEDTTSEATIVIGGGIPQDWVSRPMTVSLLSIPGGSISWHWDGHRMHVTTRGTPWRIKLGATFPRGTEVSLTILPNYPAN